MKEEKFTIDDAQLASFLRNEILKDSMTETPPIETGKLMESFEYISKPKKQTSPIFTMSEDEILDFVESFEVAELATLSVEELNHIGKVLGVDPNILIEGEE